MTYSLIFTSEFDTRLATYLKGDRSRLHDVIHFFSELKSDPNSISLNSQKVSIKQYGTHYAYSLTSYVHIIWGYDQHKKAIWLLSIYTDK